MADTPHCLFEITYEHCTKKKCMSHYCCEALHTVNNLLLPGTKLTPLALCIMIL